MTDWTDELRYAEREVNAARSGDLTSRQTYIRSAIAHLQAADEAITAEIEGPREIEQSAPPMPETDMLNG